MLIRFEKLLVGDEIIIPSNSNLKYLKVLRLGKNSHACSFHKGVTEVNIQNIYNGTPYKTYKDATCEADITKHNATFYLKNQGGYKDIWLLKRESW